MEFDSDSDEELFNAVVSVEQRIAARVANVDSEVPKPKTSYHKFLHDHFGHTNFRNGQLEIIQSIINEQRDNLAVMSTGQGKSLCYQFPALWTGGLTIVICPLISLMIDQVTSMNKANITATFLGSAQIKSNEIRQRLVETNFYRLLYVCPEYIIANKSLITQLKEKLTLIAIDEAHCVSHWGHDFRPEYQQLGELRRLAPHVPIFATTATATECVQHEIRLSLSLNNPLITCTGFDRPNLEFVLRSKLGFLDRVRTLVRSLVDGSIIVYCFTKVECEDFTEILQKENIVCEFYHAGLSKEVRSTIQAKFRNDEVKLIFATCAFGMGIDKPDVRYVLHYGATRSIESYYQEVGRAGRDGAKSKSILFYDKKDALFHMLLRNQKIYEQASSYGKRSQLWLAAYMEQFLLSKRCRRLDILQYFQGLSVTCSPRPDCCDNCQSGMSSKYTYRYRNMDENGFFDFTNDSRCLLSYIKSFSHSLSRDPKSFRRKNGLSHHDENYWDGLADVLERLLYLKTYITTSQVANRTVTDTTVQLSEQGLSWLSDKNETMKFQLQPFDKLTKYVEIKELSDPQIDRKISNSNQIDRTLYDKLIITRNTLADFLDISHVDITTDAVIADITAKKPMNVDHFRNEKFEDFTELKIKKYARSFVNCITDHQTKTNATMRPTTSERRMVELIKDNPYPDKKFNSRITLEHHTLMNLITEKHAIEEILLRMSSSLTTIVNMSVELLRAGHLITKNDLHRLFGIDESMFSSISSRLPGNLFVSDVSNIISEMLEYSRDFIELVSSYRLPRAHLSNLCVEYDDPDIIPYAAERFIPTTSSARHTDFMLPLVEMSWVQVGPSFHFICGEESDSEEYQNETDDEVSSD